MITAAALRAVTRAESARALLQFGVGRFRRRLSSTFHQREPACKRKPAPWPRLGHFRSRKNRAAPAAGTDAGLCPAGASAQPAGETRRSEHEPRTAGATK